MEDVLLKQVIPEYKKNWMYYKGDAFRVNEKYYLVHETYAYYGMMRTTDQKNRPPDMDIAEAESKGLIEEFLVIPMRKAVGQRENNVEILLIESHNDMENANGY